MDNRTDIILRNTLRYSALRGLPDDRGVLRAARQSGTMADFIGLLAGRTTKVATIEEINAASTEGWASKE